MSCATQHPAKWDEIHQQRQQRPTTTASTTKRTEPPTKTKGKAAANNDGINGQCKYSGSTQPSKPCELGVGSLTACPNTGGAFLEDAEDSPLEEAVVDPRPLAPAPPPGEGAPVPPPSSWRDWIDLTSPRKEKHRYDRSNSSILRMDVI